MRVQTKQTNHRQWARYLTFTLTSHKQNLRWVLTAQSACTTPQEALPFPTFPSYCWREYFSWGSSGPENCANWVQPRSPNFSCQTTINTPIPDKGKKLSTKENETRKGKIQFTPAKKARLWRLHGTLGSVSGAGRLLSLRKNRCIVFYVCLTKSHIKSHLDGFCFPKWMDCSTSRRIKKYKTPNRYKMSFYKLRKNKTQHLLPPLPSCILQIFKTSFFVTRTSKWKKKKA